MKIIDPETWTRRTSFNSFIDYTDPTFSVTVRIDVTKLWHRCKREGTSFFIDFLFEVMQAVNSIDEFKTRILGDEIVIHDVVHPGFVVIREDESITTARIEMTDDYPEFYNRVRQAIDNAKTQDSKKCINLGYGNEYIYLSCLPWLDFTSISNPYDFENKEATSIPRIVWGKVVEEQDSRFTLAFDVSAHHALMDGYQVYRLIRTIQNSVDELDGMN